MASWISKIAMALQSNEGYANFFVADVRERTGREVSDQEILEAVRETKKHPLPWKEYHGRQVQWTTAKPAEAVVRYLKNPSGYYRDVQERQQERLRDEEPLQHQKESRKKQREMLEQLERQADKLTQDQEWQEVAKVCRRWLEIAPDSVPPMYRLAHAYYNLARTSWLLIKQRRLDLMDQKREVGSRKTQIGGRDAVMPDVRRDMFMMGISAGQRRIVRVRLRVVPVQLFAATPDLVAIAFDDQRAGIPGQAFVRHQAMSAGEGQFTAELGQQPATSNHDQRRAQDARKLLGQAVDKGFILMQRLEWVHARGALAVK